MQFHFCESVYVFILILLSRITGNLLLTDDKIVKLADFGLAREEAETEMTSEAGTYRWMAPEVFYICEIIVLHPLLSNPMTYALYL